MTTLFVASGGGGDVLASTIIHSVCELSDEPGVIATYAWDRLLVDPLPGPRGVTDFNGLVRLAPLTLQITSQTQPIPPAGSTLPRLACELTDALVLMDPYRGAVGMAEQLADMAAFFGAERVQIVDVGGDILARGDEQTLRSPLADTLALAACASLPVPVEVLVVGLGLDAELDVDYARARLGSDPAVHARIGAEHVEPLEATFEWHPSEATAMLVAAARGVRGQVEVRDAGTAVTLSEETPTVFRTALGDLLQDSPLAQRMLGTTSLEQVEQVVRDVCGFCEIDSEREKAQRLGQRPAGILTLPEFSARLKDFESQVRDRGADYVTFRRIAEQVGRPQGGYETMRRHMIETWPEQYAWPIWSVRSS